MKKITYLFASLIIVALIVSCSKDATNDDDAMLKKAVATGLSNPGSDGGITPYIITGANNGGNRTCAEVAAWKGLSANYFHCGDKVDYNNGAFASTFPSGLNVTVTDGKYVSFKIDDCIQFGDKFYKVGAVIVKGSNAANVYFYADGTLSDSGLASPYNASGNPAGLSNLSFCFVECEAKPVWVIALKTLIAVPGIEDYAWAVSGGEGSANNPLKMGYNKYKFNSQNTFPLMYWGADQIGTISAMDYWENNTHYLEVVIDTYEDAWLFKGSFLYVGTLDGFNSYLTPISAGYYNVEWGNFLFTAMNDSYSRIFKIPFNQITE
jgi:hypothetical protein